MTVRNPRQGGEVVLREVIEPTVQGRSVAMPTSRGCLKDRRNPPASSEGGACAAKALPARTTGQMLDREHRPCILGKSLRPISNRTLESRSKKEDSGDFSELSETSFWNLFHVPGSASVQPGFQHRRLHGRSHGGC